MSDTNTQGNNRRRRSRGGRPRSGGSSQNSGTRTTSTPRAGVKKPSGFQKFLSAITFGLLGKPQTLPRAVTPQPINRKPRPEGSSRPPRDSKPSREPASANPEEVTTDRLYVGNLSYDATESDLFELFSGLGSVRNCEVVVNNRTQRSKGFAFVTMGSVDEARRAVQELGGKDFMNRPLQLSGAKPFGSGDGRERSDDDSDS